MKKISVQELATVVGGNSNRQCLIDGFITGGLIIIGGLAGGLFGALGGGVGGFGSGNSNGCFN